MPRVPSTTPDDIASLPIGYDRADGTGDFLGTPTQGLVVTAPDGVDTIDDVPLNETPDSPIMERAEQETVTHTYTTSWENAKERYDIMPRGTLTQDSKGNLFRILSTSIQHLRGDVGQLHVVSEGIIDCPPDEFSCVPVKLGLDILKYPRYFYALMPTSQNPAFTGVADTPFQESVKSSIIRMIQAYRENPFIPDSKNIGALVGTLHDNVLSVFTSGKINIAVTNPNYDPAFKATPPPTIGTTYPGNGNLPYPSAPAAQGDANPMIYYTEFDLANVADDPNDRIITAFAAAQEMLSKLWRSEDTPLTVGWEITWAEYYPWPTILNPGGYVEDPLSEAAVPPLPDYFWQRRDAQGVITGDIFDFMEYANPQCYAIDGIAGNGTTISWLRDCDTVEFQRTWFKVTHKWLGAPIGAWDAQLYNSDDRPQVPTDYVTLNLFNPATP